LRIEEEENLRKARNPRKVEEILENGMEMVYHEVRENVNYLQEIKEEIVQKLIESKQNIAKNVLNRIKEMLEQENVRNEIKQILRSIKGKLENEEKWSKFQGIPVDLQ
jgi:DNA-binding transcriptional regulator GbsR (MarR family)